MEKEIADICANYGPVNDVRIVHDYKTNRPRVGFCEFQDRKGAENAICNMIGVELNGHVLFVKATR
uniref:RRM domain-containing protein n=1 Tax=Meloidogyne hapla TaxID=6305 RepID=A0A1I8B5C3_MELHA